MSKFPVMRNAIAIILTLFIAILLTMIPLPSWANWYRPDWVALVIIFWCITVPFRFGVMVPWIVGLLLDAILGTLLGEHALALVILAYLTIKLQPRIQMFPGWQRWLTVFLLLLFYQLLLFLMQGLLGNVPMTWRYWMAPLTSAIIWPFLFLLLRFVQRRFKVVDELQMRRFTYSREVN